MRALLLAATFAAPLAACTQPPQQTERPDTQVGPATIACNDVTPDAARQVAVSEEVATAAAASDLRGGSIAPGAYDLISASRIGSARGWAGTRAVALNVSEDQAGAVTFNWAGADPGGQVDRWTGSFTEAPIPRLTYTCGRMGEVAAEFATQNNMLQLRLQDGAGGQLALQFERRS